MPKQISGENVSIGQDRLKLGKVEGIQKILNENEQIVTTCEILKLHKSGKWVKKSMLLTTHRLLILEMQTKEMKRTIKLNNVMAMTKNMTKGKFNFAVHVRDEHDISFYSRERDELFKHIKECYFSTVNRNLPIYGVA